MKQCGITLAIIATGVSGFIWCDPTPNKTGKITAQPSASVSDSKNVERKPDDEWKDVVEDLKAKVAILLLSFRSDNIDKQKEKFIEKLRRAKEREKTIKPSSVKSDDFYTREQTDRLFLAHQRRLYNNYATAYNQLSQGLQTANVKAFYSEDLSKIKSTLDDIKKALEKSHTTDLERKIEILLRELRDVSSLEWLKALNETYKKLKAEYQVLVRHGIVSNSIKLNLKIIENNLVSEELDFVHQEIKVFRNALSVESGSGSSALSSEDIETGIKSVEERISHFSARNEDSRIFLKIKKINSEIDELKGRLEQKKRDIRATSSQAPERIKELINSLHQTNPYKKGGGSAVSLTDLKLRYKKAIREEEELKEDMTHDQKEGIFHNLKSLKLRIQSDEVPELNKEVVHLNSLLSSKPSTSIVDIKRRYDELTNRYTENKEYLEDKDRSRLEKQLNDIKQKIQDMDNASKTSAISGQGLRGLLYGAGALLAGYYTFNNNSSAPSQTKLFGALFSSILGFSAFSSLSKWFLPAKKKAQEGNSFSVEPVR